MIYQDLARARTDHFKAIEAQREAANEVAARQYDLDIVEGAVYAALKDEALPATLIPKLAKANKDVAAARRALSIAEGIYKTAQARTQATYLDWKAADEQYKREWVQEGM